MISAVDFFIIIFIFYLAVSGWEANILFHQLAALEFLFYWNVHFEIFIFKVQYRTFERSFTRVKSLTTIR